jgi:hypothetical protein
MPIPNYKNRSADEIARSRDFDDSAHHVFSALSWSDYAEKNHAPLALHYGAFHLRTGIEQLWSEILFAAKGGSLGRNEYRNALKSTTTLYKLIDAQAPHYKKFAEFDQLIAKIDSKPHPPTVIWDISRLKRIHGECGGLLLHFQGVSLEGYMSPNWVNERSKFLHDSALWIANTMSERGNLVVYSPEGLKKPEVFSIWERFRDGKIDDTDVLNGLRIIQPMVKDRPHTPTS